MKSNDAGDFCVLYVEPADERAALLEFISEQKKPVVIMLPTQSGLKVFQQPDHYSELKNVKRQFDLQIVFVISGNEQRALTMDKILWRSFSRGGDAVTLTSWQTPQSRASFPGGFPESLCDLRL